MKDLRVLFMGTPDFAVHILDHLVNKEYQIVGVVTAPDKPAGRGQRLHKSAVKRYAEKKGLHILQPKNLKSEEFQEGLKEISPDISVVVAFRMLPKMVWNFPPMGTFNLHASLLPNYRGAAPINWAIINGETKTGVSTFFLDEAIDTGAVIAQSEVNILPEDNAGTLHDKLMTQGAELVDHTLRLIQSGKAQPQKQNLEQSIKPAPKFDNENTRIDWQQSTKKINDFVRGLYPYPVAWTTLINGEKTLRCKIFKIKPLKASHQLHPGQLVKTKTDLKIAVKDGFIQIEEMQLPGKKRLPISDIINGLHLADNAKMH